MVTTSDLNKQVKPANEKDYSDSLISDFSSPVFQKAFKQYFAEVDVKVNDWDGLFEEMNSEVGNSAFVRTADDGRIIGFILFKPIEFTSWFFDETCGFIREFWVSPEFRNQGHGNALISLAEDYFIKKGIQTSILTTDTAESFYLKHGYFKAFACKAKNQFDVFKKRLN